MNNLNEDNQWLQVSSDYIPLPMLSASSLVGNHHTKGHMEENARGYGLVHVIAFILNKIVDQRSADRVLSVSLTNFHATRPPSIHLIDYLLRILKYASCSSECFVLALIYIDRLEQAIVEKSNQPVVSQLSVHRIVLISVVLAAKFFDDQYYNNAFYAKVGGISCQEINTLEKDFCAAINYRFHVTTEEYSRYYNELAKHPEFLDNYKEKSSLYSREMKMCYPEELSLDVNNGFNNNIRRKGLYDRSTKMLKSVAYSVIYDKQHSEKLLSYMAVFVYDNNMRIEYLESLNASTLHCTRYLLCPPARSCISMSPTTHYLPSPYVSPVLNRIIPSPFCMSTNLISNNRNSNSNDKMTGKSLYRNDFIPSRGSIDWNSYPSTYGQHQLSVDEDPQHNNYFPYNGYNEYVPSGNQHQHLCPTYYPPVSFANNGALPFSCHDCVIKSSDPSNAYDMVQPHNTMTAVTSDRYFEAYSKRMHEIQTTL